EDHLLHLARGRFALLPETLLASYENGKPPPRQMEQMVLAPMRQLSAHEVRHCLGLRQHLAASVNDRAPVLAHPVPLVQLTAGGSFDASSAYATGVGRWDKVAINYGYRELAPDSEKQELATILDNARADGLLYISDGDTRPDGSAHPQAHLWDNGTNA